jgi:hypothetical protein
MEDNKNQEVESTNTPENEINTEANETIIETGEPKMKKFFKFLKKRKAFIAPVLLALALLITVLYYRYTISKMESNFEQDKQEYKEMFADQMDSLRLDNAYDISRIFSWSVRSEYMRGNKEQVSLLLNHFVKTPNISSVSMINADGLIELSTDKKVEGNKYSDPSNLVNPPQKVENNSLIIPLTGINETLGHLEVRFEKMQTQL